MIIYHPDPTSPLYRSAEMWKVLARIEQRRRQKKAEQAYRRKQEKIEAVRRDTVKVIKPMLRPGTIVSVSLVSVARSGMSRRVKLYVTYKGQIRDITREAAAILDWHYNGDSLRVDGCGTDAAFLVVAELSRYLYPKGYKVPKDGHYRGFATDANGWDKSGEYALRNRWI